MPSRLPFRSRPIGVATRCALAFAVCLTTLASPAAAQAGQIAVSGYVSPRCWIVPNGAVGPARERLPSSTAAGAAEVRCSDPALRVQVQQREAMLRVSSASPATDISREATTHTALTVTVSPRS